MQTLCRFVFAPQGENEPTQEKSTIMAVITLTIDGKLISARADETVLEAAQAAESRIFVIWPGMLTHLAQVLHSRRNCFCQLGMFQTYVIVRYYPLRKASIVSQGCEKRSDDAEGRSCNVAYSSYATEMALYLMCLVCFAQPGETYQTQLKRRRDSRPAPRRPPSRVCRSASAGAAGYDPRGRLRLQCRLRRGLRVG